MLGSGGTHFLDSATLSQMKSYREPQNMLKALVAEEGPSRSPIPRITITFKTVTVCGVLAMGQGLGDPSASISGSFILLCMYPAWGL